MKNFKKAVAGILIVIFGIIVVPVMPAKAGTYPVLLPEDLYQECTVGDIVDIKYLYWPEYKSEKIGVYVYDPNGEMVACKEQTFYDPDPEDDTYALKLDTKDYAPGTYTIEANVSFYTMYSWYELSAPVVSYLTIKSKPGSTTTSESKTSDITSKNYKDAKTISLNKKYTKTWNSSNCKDNSIVKFKIKKAHHQLV